MARDYARENQRREARARAAGFDSAAAQRKAKGQGRGFHPSELRASVRSPNVAAVVPDFTRNAQGQITRIRVVVTDVNGKQRVHTIRKPTDQQIRNLAQLVDDEGVPFLPGYSGAKRKGK